MNTIGLDIGTTTVCGVLADGETGRMLSSRTLLNDAALPGTEPCESLQDPARLEKLCRTLIEALNGIGGKAAAIGISNQMHGILYLNAQGEAISPLYTWQDARGNLPDGDGIPFAERLSALTGYTMATGYGLTTHWVNLQRRLVPEGAAFLCTIGDYVAMRLTGSATPRMHASNAAGLGLFDLSLGAFDPAALRAAGIDAGMLPEVSQNVLCVGRTPEGIAVSLALGDNQAGFYGSGSGDGAIFVNVGTSGQVSMLTKQGCAASGIDVRPFLGPQKLAVGCSLCGGDAYASLRRFYERTAALFGVHFEKMYDTMNSAAAALYETPQKLGSLRVDTRLRGTRADAALRGCVSGLGIDTSTPEHLTLGVLVGICDELHALSRQIPGSEGAKRLVGSGNGLRMNPLLRRIFSDRFNMPLRVPPYEEEAAYGVAILSLHALGAYPTPQAAQALIPS